MKAILADDEPLLAQSLKAALAEAWPELEVVALAANGLEAVEAAERLRPDVAFLDIRMPGLTGLEAAAEIAERLGDAAPAIVFVTAYDEYATKAFDVAAADYVLKPVQVDRLRATATRLKARRIDFASLAAQLRALGTLAPRAEPLSQVMAGAGSTVKLIPIDEVCYFKSADKYTSVVTAEGESLLRTALKDLAPQLPKGFQQVHRGTIVRLNAVASAVRDESGRVTLRLHERKEALPVSRIYADLFKAM